MIIKATIRTHMVGSQVEDEIEVDSAVWNSMTPEEQEQYVYEIMCQYIDFWYKAEEDDKT